MPLSFIPNYRDRAYDDLFSQLREQPRIRALIGAVMGGIQELEEEAMDTLLGFRVGSALGDQLDIIAEIVGEQRGGLSDTSLRRIVRARIAANRSNGSIADMENVFALATTGPDPEDFVRIYDKYPASFRGEVVSVRSLTPEEEIRAGRLVQIAKPLGVGASLVSSSPDALRFHPRGSGEQTFDGPLFSSLFATP